jgi:tricorn protease
MGHFFTRLPRQGSHAKRYTGGYVESLWRFDRKAKEARPLTADFRGTSRSPMLSKDRVYFASDRDGTMNLWSMSHDGRNRQQLTRFASWDVLGGNLDESRIVFQNGCDLWLYDIDADKTSRIPITLASDFDQTREHWVDEPLKYLTHYDLSRDGKHLALTVRGRVFISSTQRGRLRRLNSAADVRLRGATFHPQSNDIITLSDENGETEFWRYPSDGAAAARQITSDAATLRFMGDFSPNGKKVAYTDRNQRLWILDVKSGASRQVAVCTAWNNFDNPDLSWSSDSRWLAFVNFESNTNRRIFIFDTSKKTSQPVPVTTPRLESYSPTWSVDGKWLYFLSDRSFRSVQQSPWGARQPEPYLDKTTRIYQLALPSPLRSPFQRDDVGGQLDKSESTAQKQPAKPQAEKQATPVVKIDFDGLSARLHVVPVEAGNYRRLRAVSTHLYLLLTPVALDRKTHVVALPITDDPDKQKLTTIAEDATGFDLSIDRSTLALRRKRDFFVFPTNGKKPESLTKKKVDLGEVKFSISPLQEWTQIFNDAWRLHRDYFYDPKMHRVDWKRERDRHAALLPRVTDRSELDDLIAQMVGELSAMHTNIRTGDVRKGTDDVSIGYLGAYLSRRQNKGFRVDHILRADPDFPQDLSPLAKPGVDVRKGDVIIAINGVPTLSVDDPSVLLRNKAGRKILLETKRPGQADSKRVVVKPIDARGFRSLRMSEWEYTRRLETDRRGKEQIGYFHMRAMSGSNFSEFVKGFYPVFHRKGLIIDMRQNYGGNIDSWILSRLLRKPWMYWKGRTMNPSANMQYAFGGHMVVLIDAYTISDGEAFSEGFRRLGLGKLIGTRTWGGGIWLRSSNVLIDGGIARSPEYGVYSPDRQWIIEGDGLKPDILVDNLPHATFEGRDAQLEAAIKHLQEKIAKDPRPIPQPPDGKSLRFKSPPDQSK